MSDRIIIMNCSNSREFPLCVIERKKNFVVARVNPSNIESKGKWMYALSFEPYGISFKFLTEAINSKEMNLGVSHS